MRREGLSISRASYGNLVFDEFYLRKGLVFDGHSEKMVGFADTRNKDTGAYDLSTKALQFIYVSLYAKFWFPIGYYPTGNLSSYQIQCYVEEAIGVSKIMSSANAK